MADTPTDDDYYEVLQISPNAEPDTVHRVYRLLAQRFHPDNKQTGNEAKFRQISSAYNVLSDPPQRARYDVSYNARRKDRVRLASNATQDENDFDAEQLVRLAVLELLYTRRRTEPSRRSRRSGRGAARAADGAGRRSRRVQPRRRTATRPTASRATCRCPSGSRTSSATSRRRRGRRRRPRPSTSSSSAGSGRRAPRSSSTRA